MKTKIRKRRNSQRGVFFSGMLMFVAATTNIRAQYSYTTLTLPGASQTFATAISGESIVGGDNGSLSDSGQAYLYNINSGTYTTLPLLEGKYTVGPSGISGNNIVGVYDTVVGNEGFIYDINSGTYTTLSAPGANTTYAQGIDGNNIVGYYGGGIPGQGFLYNIATRVYTTLPYVEGQYMPQPYGISGDNIVGFYYSGPDSTDDRGFIYSTSSGTYTTLSVPGKANTVACGISGDNIVGYYGNFDGTGGSVGFLYNVNSGTYTTFSVPGAQETYALGIDGNNIVGNYIDSNGVYHGFLAVPVPEPMPLGLLVVGRIIAVLVRYKKIKS